MYLLLATSSIIILVTYVVYSRLQNQALPTTKNSTYSVIKQSVLSSDTNSETSTSSESSPTSTSSSTSENITIVGSDSYIIATVKGVVYPLTITVTASNTTSWISLSDTSLVEGVTLTPDNPSVTTTIEEGVTSTTLVLGVVKGLR